MVAPRCSLVVPFHNEAGNVRPLMAAACAVLAELDPAFEALLVDDGSTDGTAAELAAVAAADPRCRVLRLGRNLGQAAALLHGLRAARGERLLTMDGDGQNDPRDFPALLALVEAGADLACGWRRERHDRWARRAMSRTAYVVRRWLLRDGVHDAGCQLRVFRREVLEVLEPGPLWQAFLPAMAAAAGLRVRELPVRHHARRHGRAHFGAWNLWWRPAVEMLRLWRRLRARRADGRNH